MPSSTLTLGDIFAVVEARFALNLKARPVTSPEAVTNDPYVGDPDGSSVVAATKTATLKSPKAASLSVQVSKLSGHVSQLFGMSSQFTDLLTANEAWRVAVTFDETRTVLDAPVSM